MAQMVKYKAYYRDAGVNPFRGNSITMHTQTVEIEDTVSREEVENMAREAQDKYVFVRLEVLGQREA